MGRKGGNDWQGNYVNGEVRERSVTKDMILLNDAGTQGGSQTLRPKPAEARKITDQPRRKIHHTKPLSFDKPSLKYPAEAPNHDFPDWKKKTRIKIRHNPTGTLGCHQPSQSKTLQQLLQPSENKNKKGLIEKLGNPKKVFKG